MGISISNILATGAWMAFLSILAIIGIVVAGGFIVALLGRMVLTLVSPKQETLDDNSQYTYNAPTVNYDQSSVYVTQAEQNMQQKAPAEQVSPTDDYAYAVDVDKDLAKKEEELLNNELKASKPSEEDDFFNEFMGNDDVRFGDDDLLGMIDEISQDVLEEEQEERIATEKVESENNKGILDQYSIDDYLSNEANTSVEETDELAAEDDLFGEDPFAEQVVEEQPEQLNDVVDQQTIDEINTLKQQIKEIVESMEDNKNQSETFNQQLINILNELKEANKKDVRTEEDAEREINSLKQQLEASRVEMEQQTQEKIADKDEDIQQRLQEQLDASNAEIENLKAQLSNILAKMENPDDDAMEKEPVAEEEPEDEISALRKEVGEMLASMREENKVQTTVNTQLLEILTSMKEENLKNKEQATVETNEDAEEQVAEWKEDLEATEKELTAQFKEEMLHKSNEEQKLIRDQMESYNDEISELKEQLSFLMEQFKTQTENAKNENKVLLEQLEAERKERIRLEQEKLEEEKDSILTDAEMADLYSESTDDFASEEAVKKLEDELEDSKQEIDELKEQLNRLTNYGKEQENSIAKEIDVNEVRTADFDVDQINQITASEVESIVNEKIIDSLAEIEILKDELIQTKQEIENQYKEQLANVDAGMEYDRVSKLQASAEKVDGLNEKLAELVDELKTERENIKQTSENCISEMESLRQEISNNAKQGKFEDSDIAVIGPKGNKVALVAKDDAVAEMVETIDIETAKQISNDELNEIVASRLEESNKAIEALKEEIAQLKKELAEKNETPVQPEVPVVRSPLFDVEMIKTITAQEVEKKVQERLAEAMKEIEAMKAQLELSKKEIERQYKEELAINRNGESEVKDKLKGSAAEVIELKEQLSDLTEQIELEHQEAKQNSQEIAVQLDQDRKEKQEIAKQQLAIAEQSESSENAEVMVIGPKDNQVALVTGVTMLSEYVGEEDIPTIDIETVKQLTEQEIEEKVQIRMASSIIEIEELKKQILNLSIQIQEIKGNPTDDDEKPLVFHYSTEEAYLERLAVLEERLKSAKKDLKINNKELNPLEKVKRTLERDKVKLRRKYAIVAKKKVALYGVNNYVDIDKDKAEKLAQELELLEGLKLSVNHCEEVMNANIDRYPILVHTNKILKENIANIESDIATLNKELAALRAQNGEGENE